MAWWFFFTLFFLKFDWGWMGKRKLEVSGYTRSPWTVGSGYRHQRLEYKTGKENKLIWTDIHWSLHWVSYWQRTIFCFRFTAKWLSICLFLNDHSNSVSSTLYYIRERILFSGDESFNDLFTEKFLDVRVLLTLFQTVHAWPGASSFICRPFYSIKILCFLATFSLESHPVIFRHHTWVCAQDWLLVGLGTKLETWD